MKNSTELKILRAEIESDIKAINEIGEKLRVKLADILGVTASYYDMAALGYLLHNFYNGCESIFQRIAKVFENSLPQEEWHAALIMRMRLSIEGIRPAVISSETANQLDEYRRFRHFFRHSYGVDLKWERMVPLLEQCETTTSLFLEDIAGLWIIFWCLNRD